MIKMTYDWDWPGADASIQLAMAQEPGNATVVRSAAALNFILGHKEEALALDRRAVELDPLSASARGNLGVDAYHAGRLEEARAALQKALELNPFQPVAHIGLSQIDLAEGREQEALTESERERQPDLHTLGLAMAYFALGRKKESDAALTELIAKYHSDSAYQIAAAYAYRGEADRAFEWLDRAYAQRDGGLTGVKTDQLFNSLHRDPRYAAILKKMRLPS